MLLTNLCVQRFGMYRNRFNSFDVVVSRQIAGSYDCNCRRSNSIISCNHCSGCLRRLLEAKDRS